MAVGQGWPSSLGLMTGPAWTSTWMLCDAAVVAAGVWRQLVVQRNPTPLTNHTIMARVV